MKQAFSQGLILLSVILMDLLTGMEFDLFVPSFPELQSYFHLTPFWVEALLSVNFIGYCLSLFCVGDLADRYGRKPLLVLGLVIFVLGSLLCLYGSSYSLLFLGRLLQGIGVASPAILSFLIIADSYPVKKQQFWLSMLNGSLNIAAAVAPVIGSYVTHYFHWRGNFTVLLFMGLVTLIMTLLFIPSYKLPAQATAFSLQGYLQLLRSKPLRLVLIYFMFMFVPYWIFVGISPLLYMKDLGVTLAHFGYYQGSFALVFALGSIFFGFILNRYNQKKLLYVSSGIFAFSLITVTMATILNTASPLFITLAFLPFVIGQIFPSNLLYPLSLKLVPQAKARITAIIQGGRLIFASLSLQIAGYFYQGSFRNLGLILMSFILTSLILQIFVVENRELVDSK